MKQCLCLYLLSALTLIGVFVIGRRRLHQSVGRWREWGSRERHVGPAAPVIPWRESSSHVCVRKGKTRSSWFSKILWLNSCRSILKNSKSPSSEVKEAGTQKAAVSLMNMVYGRNKDNFIGTALHFLLKRRAKNKSQHFSCFCLCEVIWLACLECGTNQICPRAVQGFFTELSLYWKLSVGCFLMAMWNIFHGFVKHLI